MASELPSRLTKAVIPLGLPESSLPELIADIVAGDTADLAKVPGITPQIIGAAVSSFKEAFAASVRNVWITASVFAFIALCGKWLPLEGCLCTGSGMLIGQPSKASFFLINPVSDFNMHIDAPAESDEALYGDKRQTTAGSEPA